MARAKNSPRFCCSGCEFVYGLLNEKAMSRFYELRDLNPPACPVPVQSSSETYDYCDDPTFVARASRDGRILEFYLEGLNCTACLWLLEKLPELCDSAASARVDMSNSTISVVRKDGGSFSAIARTLNRLGYRPHPIETEGRAGELRVRENRRDLVRIGVAAAATGNIMILAVSLYGGADGTLGEGFRWLSGALAAPVLTWCAWPFYKSAWAGLRTRHLNIDVPIMAAVVAGIIMSIWGLATGRETTYFDSLSMLVFLLLSSRFWLKKIQQHHLDVSHLEDLLLLGTVSRISTSGRLERVSTLSLKPGDVIEISGEMMAPTDGVVASGDGIVHTAVLTGESTPIDVRPGDKIEAGSRNLGASWLMRVSRPAAESRLAQILKDTETSARNKPAIVAFADHVAQWFIGVVFFIAAVVAIVFATSDMHEGLSRALALVIVTCPCVFGMAIPLSLSLAVRAAARNGIVIKNPDVVERLAGIRTIYFDKTGTMTRGNLGVTKIEVMSDDRDVLAAALALEEGQWHPVARAIVAALENEPLPRQSAVGVEMVSGGGVRGMVAGAEFELLPLGISTKADDRVASREIKGAYGLFRREVGGDRELVARFEIGDELRSEAPALVEWMRASATKGILLSGDQENVVAACARQLGLSREDSIARATPESKSAILKAAGVNAAMIGDGANDAAALAAAGVGIAVRGSMDVSLKAADVYLTRADLGSVPKLFEIARKTRLAIYRNLAFSATFNVISGTLAVMGLMTPLWAAVLMPLSSLTVLASALMTGSRLGTSK